ncbi:MAG: TIGR04219 family outer membrane beta-barrel protein [Nitrospirae bacterium]|nr:TIGR04219 family outer membrane beta-barrel protein [Nitrospirota bacterium]
MKRFWFFAGLLFLVVTFAVPNIVSAIGFEGAIGAWSQDPSGDLSYKGESLSVENELKYDAETKAFGRVKVELPLMFPNIYFMVTPMKFEGEGSKDINFTFGDQTFNANVPFSSSARLDHYDICLYYGLPFLKTASLGKFKGEVGLNVKIIDFEAEITQSSLGLSASKSLTLPIPMIYVGAQFNPVKLIGIEGEVRGITYSSNHYYDLIGRVKVRPIEHAFIAGGYRYENVKIDESDVIAELDFSGPFIEVGVEF